MPAQYTTASLGGTVLDPSGGTVPGAKVTVENTATGFSLSVTTKASGTYGFPLLSVGIYKLMVEKEGFTTYVQPGIVLTVNQSATQQVTLKVGAVSQQVTVTGTAPLVTTSSATVGQLINSQQVLDLPLNGREVQSLLFLGAGTTDTTDHYCGFGCIGGVFPGEQYAKANGTISNSANYQLDGADFNNVLLNTNLPFPNPDAVQEFNTQTDNMSAEYGNSVGAVVSVVTKSGTNETHGSAFEFLRNGALNARNYFAPEADKLKRNQFGATLGGPIKKGTLFYFGTYQGTRIRTASEGVVANVPTQDERGGDFSDICQTGFTNGICNDRDQNNNVIDQLVDPLTGSPFSKNQIPTTRLSQVAQNFLKSIPLPNGADRRLTFVGPAARPNQDQFLIKIDYQHNQHQLSGHYFFNRFDQPAFTPTTNLLQASGGQLVKSQNVSLNYVHTVSPTLLFNTWYGLNHESGESLEGAPFGFTKVGVNIAEPTPPTMTVVVSPGSGGFTIRTGNFGNFTRRVQTLREDITWTRGRHELHFGGSYSRLHAPKANHFLMGGEFDFTNSLSGDFIGDFMLGQASTFTQGGGIFYDFSQNRFSGFVQDNWHARPRLTLNLGLRWEPFMPFRESRGRIGCYVPGQQSVRYPSAPVGLLYAGDNPDPGCPAGATNPNLSNWAPRFGFAYQVTADGKTSLRGGVGLYYSIPNLVAYQDVVSIPPFAPIVSLTDVSFADPYGSAGVTNPFPAQFGPNVAGPNTPFPIPLDLPQILDRNLRAPEVTSWNLTLERQFGESWLLRAAYVGNKGTHLFGTGDQEQGQQQLNPAIYVPGQSTVDNTQDRRIDPNFANIGLITSAINSHYHALQLTTEKRLGHGLQLLANYTWSKELNDFAPVGAFCCNTNPFNRHFDYGLSDDDLTHVFKLSAVYQLPGFRQNGWWTKFTNGWVASSIISWQSGFPLTIFSGVDNSFSGVGEDRADFLGTSIHQAVLDPNRPHSQLVQHYFDTSLFGNNAVGTFGNTGKNILRGPGFLSTDLALMQNTKLTERLSLQFRAEAFNVFNNVNFFNPDNIVADGPGAFGTITAAHDPRILQFAVKVVF